MVVIYKEGRNWEVLSKVYITLPLYGQGMWGKEGRKGKVVGVEEHGELP